MSSLPTTYEGAVGGIDDVENNTEEIKRIWMDRNCCVPDCKCPFCPFKGPEVSLNEAVTLPDAAAIAIQHNIESNSNQDENNNNATSDDANLSRYYCALGGQRYAWDAFQVSDFWDKYAYGKPAEAIVADPEGIIQIKLKYDYRIDINISKSVRLINEEHNIIVAMSHDGSCGCIVHPMAKLFYKNNEVDVEINDGATCFKKAMFNEKGIAFAVPERNRVKYQLQPGGLKTCNQRFVNMDGHQFSDWVFKEGALYGPDYVEGCSRVLLAAAHFVDLLDRDNYIINGIQIVQTPGGAVTVIFGDAEDDCKFELKSATLGGTGYLQTPDLHFSVSLGSQDNRFYEDDNHVGLPHVFAKQISTCKRIHHNGMTTQFRLNGQVVELDNEGKCRLV